MSIFYRSNLQTTIQTANLDVVYNKLYSTAKTWTLAGHILPANELFDLLGEALPNRERSAHTQYGLEVMWTISGSRPATIPATTKSLAAIDQLRWNELYHISANYHPSFLDRFAHQPADSLQGKPLLITALELAYDTSSPNNRASAKQLSLALSYVQRYLSQPTIGGYDLMHALEAAARLSITLHQPDTARQLLLRWGREYSTYYLNVTANSLLANVEIARLLQTGLLAEPLGITAEACTTALPQIKAALAERLTNGRINYFPDWESLLSKLTASESPSPQRTPAAKDQIAAEEARLRIELPEDYKAFLQLTNGLHADEYNLRPSLLSIEDIGRLADKEGVLLDIWEDFYADEDYAHVDFGEAILIGGHQEENQVLLVPTKPTGFECWYFMNTGEVSYPSFRAYMESEAQEH